MKVNIDLPVALELLSHDHLEGKSDLKPIVIVVQHERSSVVTAEFPKITNT